MKELLLLCMAICNNDTNSNKDVEEGYIAKTLYLFLKYGLFAELEALCVDSMHGLRKLVVVHPSMTSADRNNLSFMHTCSTAMLSIILAETQKLAFCWQVAHPTHDHNFAYTWLSPWSN